MWFQSDASVDFQFVSRANRVPGIVGLRFFPRFLFTSSELNDIGSDLLRWQQTQSVSHLHTLSSAWVSAKQRRMAHKLYYRIYVMAPLHSVSGYLDDIEDWTWTEQWFDLQWTSERRRTERAERADDGTALSCDVLPKVVNVVRNMYWIYFL